MTDAPIFYEISALPGDRVGLAGYREGIDMEQGPSSLYIEYHPSNPRGRWSRRLIPEWVVSITPFQMPSGALKNFAALTMQNSVLLFDGRAAVEKLPSDNDSGSRLRQIGQHLFACDFEGRIFTRDNEGWKKLPQSLYSDAPLFDKCIVDIGGPAESEVYFSGRGGLGFWDGVSARRLNAPRDLTQIFVASPSEIWISGWDGTLLQGNYKDGFRKISTNSNVSFSSVTMFEDLIFLGGAERFYCFDGKMLFPVKTGLDPEPKVIRQVSASDEALWGIGDKDFVRFDGRNWSRIPYPDKRHDAP